MFETAMFLETMEKVQERAHKTSVAHGFWEGAENNSIPTKLCLIHSEVSEWLEAFRTDPTAPCGKVVERLPRVVDNFGNPVTMPLSVADGACPDGVRPVTKEEEEAADILIRLMDLCEARGIDLARVTLAKMHYNESRPYKHGGKRC